MDKIGSLRHFSEILERVSDVLQNATILATDNSNDRLEQEIKEVKRKLSNRIFYLGLLGEFKRGKSTLLNALVGTSLIPTGVLPLTSIITAVQYGNEPRAEIVLKTGQRIFIDPMDIGEYVTESKNPKNRNNVERAELFLSSDLLKDGLVLLDTPGVGSFYEHNTELTYSWLDIFVELATLEHTLSEKAFLCFPVVKRKLRSGTNCCPALTKVSRNSTKRLIKVRPILLPRFQQHSGERWNCNSRTQCNSGN